MKDSVVDKLKALYALQVLHSQLDELHFRRGELPEQIEDLNAEIARTEQKIEKLKDEIASSKESVSKYAADTEDLKAHIRKCEAQKDDVRNNREYEALDKQIETNNLSIQINDKRLGSLTTLIEERSLLLEEAKGNLLTRKEDLQIVEKALTKIMEETASEEEILDKKAKEIEKTIEPRLLTSYYKLRSNYHTRLAVVTIDRNACSGCHSELPPQKLSDIRQLKSLLVCEQCGRIMVDDGLAEEVTASLK